MIASPTTTSAAATTMEKNARTWPFKLLCIRENATSVRFTAFSCSSTDMKMISAFLRVRTPTLPIANRIDESTRKYEMGVLMPPAPARPAPGPRCALPSPPG